jgi:acyl-CoA thioesterase-1
MSSVVSARLFVVLLLICVGRLCSADTIVVVGDSLSAGSGLPRDAGWVVLLERRLAEDRRSATVINASISGETTGGGRLRIDDLLRQHQPDIVIVELGANDGLRGARISRIQDNLSAIVDACRKHGAGVLVIGMRIPPNYGRDYVNRFHATYAQVAEKHGATLVPFMLAGFADDQSLFQDDGIHPTANAQKFILDNVYQYLMPML